MFGFVRALRRMVLVLWLLLGIIVTLVVGHLLVLLVQFWKYARIINKIPGRKCVPLFGNALVAWVPYEDVINTISKLFFEQQEACRSILRIWIGPFAVVTIIKGSSCEVILKSSKHVNKSKQYEFSRGILGNGLLISKRELWEKRRKMINPSFTVPVIKEFIPIFNEQIQICLQQFQKVDDGRIFDVVPYCRNLALDMITESIMGVKVNAQENTANEIVQAHHQMGELFAKRVANPLLYSTFIYNLTSYGKQELQICKIIHNFALKVIRERVKYLKQRKLQQNIQNGVERVDEKVIYGEKRRLTTLDLLIEGTCDGKKLNDDEIKDEVIIEIAAGHETTADSIAFAVYMMGLNPEAQKRAQEEVDSVLGESDLSITIDDLSNLKYLDAAIKETHRLFPPIPIFARQIDEDVIIDGYTIPAGTTVAILIYVIHRDPEIFPDPDKFDPERFLGANANGRSIYDYMPFSQGPRNCIGYKMGIWETKMAVAKILQKYDIISHDKPETLKMVITPDYRSFHGLRISLRKRKQF